MKDASKAQDRMQAAGSAPVSMKLGSAMAMGKWKAEVRDPDGNLLQTLDWQNLIVDTGLDQLLGTGLAGAGPWYIGLTDGTPTVAAADTMALHAGWVEVAGYDETARQAWTPGTVASQTVNNNAVPAVFTITSNSTTIGGAFLSDSSTKSGTTGLLFAVGAFVQTDVVLSAGATITVTAEFTQVAV
mgnify:CR=1 FL=1|tara:strand:+ start:2392 stop:2949 length:558 start_codon:yes stop_codon:yes gene_type:complete